MTMSGNWFFYAQIESKVVVDYNQLGASIRITEETHTPKDNNGRLDKKKAWVYFDFSSTFSDLSGWSTGNYEDYNLSYDNARNITSVLLTREGGKSFQVDITYDYSIKKSNSVTTYTGGVLSSKSSCVYDSKSRMTEYSHNLESSDSKEAYTYIGESTVYNSIEYYIWNGKDFVKSTKNMYVKNANGQNTMHQTYSWAETKWVLSSYTIYYPNEYTSDLEIEESEEVGADNKGSFNVGFSLPQDAEVTGSFYITFPKGFVLDETSTVLADGLADKYTITITSQEGKNSWFVEIKEKTLRSLSTRSDSFYKQILTIGYIADESAEQGNYTAEISNLNFALPDGTNIIEQKREVNITVSRGAVANEDINAADKLKAGTQDGMAKITGLTAGERWSIYSVTGALVKTAIADSDEATAYLPGRGVYIITAGKEVVKIVW